MAVQLTWISPAVDAAILAKRSEPPLPEERVRQWLRQVSRERKVPLTALARYIGFKRETLRQAIDSGKISQVMRGRLTPVIELIEDGKMRFERCGRGWHLVHVEKSPPRKRRRHESRRANVG